MGELKELFFEKQPHISKFVGVLYDTGSFSPNIIQIHKMRQYLDEKIEVTYHFAHITFMV